MRMQIWDTNILRRMAENELNISMIPKDARPAVAPVAIIELLTRVTPENREIKIRAAREILNNNLIILALPFTHMKYMLGRLIDRDIEPERNHFLEILKIFIEGRETGFYIPSGITFESYREVQERGQEEAILQQRSALLKLAKDHGEDLKKFERLKQRTFPKWSTIKSFAKLTLAKDEADLDPMVRISDIDKFIQLFEPYVDIFQQFSIKEGLREGKYDRNNTADLTQLLYLQDHSYLLTGEKKWKKFAEEAGHEDSVVLL
jgi:hypothetical protein